LNRDELEVKLCRWLKEIRKGTLELFILTSLNRQPMYGAKVSKFLYDLTDGDFILKAGTIYPILKRLEQEGWIKGQLVESQDGEKGPGRKVYEITTPGQKLSDLMLSKWVRNFNLLFKMFKKEMGVLDEILKEFSELNKYMDI
jgi:PadR family transcriptional regulator PadR